MHPLVPTCSHMATYVCLTGSSSVLSHYKLEEDIDFMLFLFRRISEIGLDKTKRSKNWTFTGEIYQLQQVFATARTTNMIYENILYKPFNANQGHSSRVHARVSRNRTYITVLSSASDQFSKFGLYHVMRTIR